MNLSDCMPRKMIYQNILAFLVIAAKKIKLIYMQTYITNLYDALRKRLYGFYEFDFRLIAALIFRNGRWVICRMK